MGITSETGPGISSGSASHAPSVNRLVSIHLVAGLLAFTAFMAGIAAMYPLSDWLVARYIYSLAGVQYGQKSLGLILQREALRHSDLMPLYGASEIWFESQYHARDVFAQAPTGFSVFTVGEQGGLVFSALQSFGALGDDLRGKRVVLSLTATMFVIPIDGNLDTRYDFNYSELQTLTLLLNPGLSAELRSDIARRLLARSYMLKRSGIVELTARVVAHRSEIPKALYYLILPMGELKRFLFSVQDRLLVLAKILAVPQWRTAPDRPIARKLDWQAMLADATSKFQATASNNPLGVLDQWWQIHKKKALLRRNQLTDELFLRNMQYAEAWIDLELTLRVLQELGAEPLLLSMPFHGSYEDFMGVSPAARKPYYTRVQALADRYGAHTAILDDHETDRFFFRDLGSHISPIGWVYYDQAIDAFFHDAVQ